MGKCWKSMRSKSFAMGIFFFFFFLQNELLDQEKAEKSASDSEGHNTEVSF